MGSNIQQYCLRWNNHRSNLLLVFEHLFQTESFTDVTLACDGLSIKCHKMVLAACSSYFQHLFMENDCRHPIVILKDIRFSEIKAILEYMYKGEVNVAQDQLAGLLKAAETLKVKGLVEDNQSKSGTPTPTPPNQSPYPPPPSMSSAEFHSTSSSTHYSKSSNSIPSKFIPNETVYDTPYNASSFPDKNSIPFHLWPSSKHPLSPSPKHSLGSNNYENSQNEPVPLKKKKFMGTNKDTPILRTVLGHTSLHNLIESQTSNPYNHHTNQLPSISHKTHMPITTNGPIEPNDKQVSPESPDHFPDDSIRSIDSDKVHEENSSFSIMELDDRTGSSGSFGPNQTQKPEWKRYKQYTRNDIMAAIDAVREGMSALQAARKYGVPSRTLYDKVKKLGITTNRPYRKGSFPLSPCHGMIKLEDTSSYSPEEPPLEPPDTDTDTGHGENGESGENGENGENREDRENRDTRENRENGENMENMENSENGENGENGSS